MLWILASEYEHGNITATHEEIAFRLRTSVEEFLSALTPLIEMGFFKSSDTLAMCKQNASEAQATSPPRDRGEAETEERQNAASAATEEKQVYDFGKNLLGANSGGVIKRLIASKDGSLPLAHAALLTAKTKSNPREYIGAIIRSRDGPSDNGRSF